MPRRPPASQRGRVLALARAILAARRVRLAYRDAGGAETERDVDPLALSWRRGAWLLAAWCHRRRAFRLFRVDRIVRVQRLAASAAGAPVSPTFDPRFFTSIGYLESGVHPPALATVRLDGAVAPVASALFPAALTERCASGAVLCHVRVTSVSELAALVASLWPDAELFRSMKVDSVAGHPRRP